MQGKNGQGLPGSRVSSGGHQRTRREERLPTEKVSEFNFNVADIPQVLIDRRVICRLFRGPLRLE